MHPAPNRDAERSSTTGSSRGELDVSGAGARPHRDRSGDATDDAGGFRRPDPGEHAFAHAHATRATLGRARVHGERGQARDRTTRWARRTIGRVTRIPHAAPSTQHDTDEGVIRPTSGCGGSTVPRGPKPRPTTRQTRPTPVSISVVTRARVDHRREREVAERGRAHHHRRQARLGRQGLSPRRWHRGGAAATRRGRRWPPRHRRPSPRPPTARRRPRAPRGHRARRANPATRLRAGSRAGCARAHLRKSGPTAPGSAASRSTATANRPPPPQLGGPPVRARSAMRPRTVARVACAPTAAPPDRRPRRRVRTAGPARARTRGSQQRDRNHADRPVLDRLFRCRREVGIDERVRQRLSPAGRQPPPRPEPSARTRSASRHDDPR